MSAPAGLIPCFLYVCVKYKIINQYMLVAYSNLNINFAVVDALRPPEFQPIQPSPEQPTVDDGDTEGEESTDIRDFFPETWIWEIFKTK